MLLVKMIRETAPGKETVVIRELSVHHRHQSSEWKSKHINTRHFCPTSTYQGNCGADVLCVDHDWAVGCSQCSGWNTLSWCSSLESSHYVWWCNAGKTSIVQGLLSLFCQSTILSFLINNLKCIACQTQKTKPLFTYMYTCVVQECSGLRQTNPYSFYTHSLVIMGS